jgi:hypothetical protein
MAAIEIGQLFKTQIPGYEDAADIQAALRLYHYGSSTYDTSTTNESNVISDSVAGHLKALKTRVQVLEDNGPGSEYSDTEPSDIPNGYIWVDSESGASLTEYPNAIYQNLAPTGTITEGTLWVDKNSTPLKMYIYDTTLGWREIGA